MVMTSYDAMVSFEETGPYVQYAHARINLSCARLTSPSADIHTA